MDERQRLKEACERIGLSADGRLLYQHFIITLMDTLPPGHECGALRSHEGRRTFARELMQLFQIKERDVGPVTSDTPSVPAAGEPASVRSATRGARRRRFAVADDAAP